MELLHSGLRYDQCNVSHDSSHVEIARKSLLMVEHENK